MCARISLCTMHWLKTYPSTLPPPLLVRLANIQTDCDRIVQPPLRVSRILFPVPGTPRPQQRSHTCLRPGFAAPSPLECVLCLWTSFCTCSWWSFWVYVYLIMLPGFCPCPRVASQEHPPRAAKAAWVCGELEISVTGQVSLCSYSGPDLCWVPLCGAR